MLLAIDVGNTHSVFAVCDGGKVLKEWRMRTDAGRTADEYGAWLLQLLRQTEWGAKSISASIISSVVPDTLFPLRKCVENYFDAMPLIVGAADVDVPMQVKLERPGEIGADRLVNAVAAYKKINAACVAVDFGTATTFDVIDEEGAYCGGVIAPGVNLSLEALHHAAAKLPSVAIQKPAKVVGTHTVEAMQSGVFYGYLGLVNGIIAAIKSERAEITQVIATGGLASLYGKWSEAIDAIHQDLTIEGLVAIYQHNSKL